MLLAVGVKILGIWCVIYWGEEGKPPLIWMIKTIFQNWQRIVEGVRGGVGRWNDGVTWRNYGTRFGISGDWILVVGFNSHPPFYILLQPQSTVSVRYSHDPSWPASSGHRDNIVMTGSQEDPGPGDDKMTLLLVIVVITRWREVTCFIPSDIGPAERARDNIDQYLKNI